MCDQNEKTPPNSLNESSEKQAWSEWIKYHATAFGFQKPEEQKMLVFWTQEWSKAGFTAKEFLDASTWLVTANPPSYRADHLNVLLRRVQEVRAMASALANKEAPPPEGDEKCPDCLGTGWAVVPRFPMPPGRWYTFAVTCRCELGCWIQNAYRKRNPLSLASYELKNPGWHDQMTEHECSQKGHVQSQEWATHLDKLLGTLRRQDGKVAHLPGTRPGDPRRFHHGSESL